LSFRISRAILRWPALASPSAELIFRQHMPAIAEIDSVVGRWSRPCFVKRFVTIGCLLVCLIVALSLLWPHGTADSKTQQSGSFVLLGFTNFPAAGRPAVFCLTNGTRSEFAYCPEAIEQRTKTGWITNRVPPWPSGWIGLRSVLAPAQSITFYVPVVTSSVPWRLSLVCAESAGATERARNFVRSVRESICAGRETVSRTFSGRRYEILSPEVSE